MNESKPIKIEEAFSELEIGKQIAKKLEETYNKKFKIIKIGTRYGQGDFDNCIAICSPEENNNMAFNVIYNKNKKKIIDDDFFAKSICFELEKYILNEFKNVNKDAVVKIEIFGKRKLEKKYSVQEFSEKYKNNNFLATIIIKGDISKELLDNVFKNINSSYKNIFLKTLIYIIPEEEFEDCYTRSKDLPELSIAFTKSYNIKNKYLMQINNNKIINIE